MTVEGPKDKILNKSLRLKCDKEIWHRPKCWLLCKKADAHCSFSLVSFTKMIVSYGGNGSILRFHQKSPSTIDYVIVTYELFLSMNLLTLIPSSCNEHHQLRIEFYHNVQVPSHWNFKQALA